MRLWEVAASWGGLMPPCPRTGDVTPDPEELESELDSVGPSEFGILILPWCYLLSNVIDPFLSSPSDISESRKPPLNHSAVRTHHPPSSLNRHWKHPRRLLPNTSRSRSPCSRNRRSHSTALLGRQRLTRPHQCYDPPPKFRRYSGHGR